MDQVCNRFWQADTLFAADDEPEDDPINAEVERAFAFSCRIKSDFESLTDAVYDSQALQIHAGISEEDARALADAEIVLQRVHDALASRYREICGG